MRVALVQELGGIDKVELQERPDPTPVSGQALVKVGSAGVGPWDVAMISGAFGRPALPYIPGFEVAGVVEAVGDGVDVRPGERVWASLGIPGGGFAEYALANVDSLGRVPDRLSFEEAAGLVVGGGTAWDGLLVRGRLRAGETVLITAAAGGVGSAAVQVAAAVGARARSAWPARAIATTCGAWVPAKCSTTTPATGSSSCSPWFPAASTSSSTLLAAIPAIKPSARCATAAARSSWSVLPTSWDGASPAKRSTPTSTGSDWTRSVGCSTRGSCAPRSKRYCRSSRCAKPCNESEVDTRAARSYSRLGR